MVDRQTVGCNRHWPGISHFPFHGHSMAPYAHHDLFIAFGGMLVPTILALTGAVVRRILGVAEAAIGMAGGYVLFFAPASVMIKLRVKPRTFSARKESARRVSGSIDRLNIAR